MYGTFMTPTYKWQEKKEEIWLSPVTKTPTPTEQSKKQRDNIKTPPKTLITQLLRTDLGRSVGVTAVTQLVWLNRFTSARNIKRKQTEILSNTGTSMTYCPLITQTFIIILVGCILLNLRKKARQRPTISDSYFEFTCRSRGMVNFTLSFTTNSY